MGLLIRDTAEEVAAHWSNDLLDEGLLFLSDPILSVERLVGPRPVPCLHGNERVDLLGHVLRRLVEHDEETSKAAGQVREPTLCLALRVKGTDREVRLGRDGAW